MSKKNKKKNKNKHNHSFTHKKQGSVTSEQSQGAEQSVITLDKHLEQLELQSMGASNSDVAPSEGTNTDDVLPELVEVVEYQSEVVASGVGTKEEGKAKGPINWNLFVVGLVLGAIIGSFIF